MIKIISPYVYSKEIMINHLAQKSASLLANWSNSLDPNPVPLASLTFIQVPPTSK
jgi:hypothetical protein